jgi:hypothetical protein
MASAESDAAWDLIRDAFTRTLDFSRHPVSNVQLALQSDEQGCRIEMTMAPSSCHVRGEDHHYDVGSSIDESPGRDDTSEALKECASQLFAEHFALCEDVLMLSPGSIVLIFGKEHEDLLSRELHNFCHHLLLPPFIVSLTTPRAPPCRCMICKAATES